MKVFISYNHNEKDFVEKLMSILEKESIDYFVDEKIDVGEDIVESIHNSMLICTHLIVVISYGSIKSSWVPYEIGYAKGCGLSIIPVITYPNLDIPMYIRNLKYIDITRNLDDFHKTILLKKMEEDKLPLQYTINNYFGYTYHDGKEVLTLIKKPADVTKQEIKEKDILPAIGITLSNKTNLPVIIKRAYIIFNNRSGIGRDPSYSEKIEAKNRKEIFLRLYTIEHVKEALEFGVKEIEIEDSLERILRIDASSFNKFIIENYQDIV